LIILEKHTIKAEPDLEEFLQKDAGSGGTLTKKHMTPRSNIGKMAKKKPVNVLSRTQHDFWTFQLPISFNFFQ